jgi:hypothetical protein
MFFSRKNHFCGDNRLQTVYSDWWVLVNILFSHKPFCQPFAQPVICSTPTFPVNIPSFGGTSLLKYAFTHAFFY